MQFLFQPLTWGFLLVGVPILVHLINMLRHRRRKWAAMDFLLESYRRNRRWVMLKQWLLLASRILAMVLLVAMLAKWVSASQWLSWIGGQTTQHYILLDDSYSMGEIEQNETAYNRALGALAGLVRSIAAAPGQHQITLIRWSRATLAMAESDERLEVDSAADLLAQSVPQDPSSLLDRLNATEPVAMQLAPQQPLELVAPLIAENADQQSDVYLITDLRRSEFNEPEELRNQLLPLTQNGTRLHVIDAAINGSDNLSVVSVTPAQEVWAVGVPLMVRFQIRNRSDRAARNVIVRVRSLTYAEGSVTAQADRPFSGQSMDLPPVVIDEIAAGETVTRRVQVIFGAPGDNVVEVALPADALTADDKRWCTIDIQAQQQVLLLDGDVRRTNAFYFEKVINPGTRLKTGMQVEVADASYLRDAAPESLAEFDVIGLLDVPRMEKQAIEKIEAFCRAGGGLIVTCGPNTNTDFVNKELYREGEGFFPVQLEGIEELGLAPITSEPQVSAHDHPIWGPLLQLESSPFFSLSIRKLCMVDSQFVGGGKLEVVATGIGNRPLLLDHTFGEGHALVLLTGLTSEWSNWAQDPTFVVLALRSLGYLGSFRRQETSNLAGTAIEMSVTGQTVIPEAEILIPARGDGSRIRWQEQIQLSDSGDVAKLSMKLDLEGMNRDLVDNMLRPGIFEAWMLTAQGQSIVQNFARNVPAAEGDLSRVTPSELEQKLSGVPFKYRKADAVTGAGLNSLESAQSTLLLALLALLLLAEQALAYSASYHAPVVGAQA